ENGDHEEARRRGDIRQSEEAVTKAVDHIEERIEMRQRLPERRQAVDRIEHTGQEGERHDEEVLKRRQLVELVGPDAGEETENAENRTAEHREGERPQRMLQR